MPLPFDDQSATGNGTITLPVASRYLDIFYDGPGILEITSNGETRKVPAGIAFLEFGAPSTTFTVTASGLWIAHANASRFVALQKAGSGGSTPTPLSATLQNAATTAGNGTEATLSGQEQVTLVFDGTATSFTVIVEGQASGSTRWDTLEVIKRGTLDILQSVTALGLYVVNTSGLAKVRARISAISGGSLTVLAR